MIVFWEAFAGSLTAWIILALAIAWLIGRSR